MPENRYYINQELLEGAVVTLEGQEYRQLIQVMRGKEGCTVELFNGRGTLASGTLIKAGKRDGDIVIEACTFSENSNQNVILVQAIPRMNRLDTILEKATELGVSEIHLFPSEKGVRKGLTPHQFSRLDAIIIAASKQCGRLWLPKLIQKPPISDWNPQQEVTLLFGDLHSKKRINDLRLTGHLAFVIGPEEGLSTDEIEKLKVIGGRGVLLHMNILRTDTAAIAAVVLLNSLII